jgi:putative sterol carrier protein
MENNLNNPEMWKKLKKIKGSLVATEKDTGISISLFFEKGTIRLQSDKTSNPSASVKADFDTLAAYSSGELNPIIGVLKGKMSVRGNLLKLLKMVMIFRTDREDMNKTGRKEQIIDTIGRIAGKIIRTEGKGRLLSSVIRNFLAQWSLGSSFKKKITSPVRSLLSRGMHHEVPEEPGSIAADVGRLITLFAASVNENRTLFPGIHDETRGDSIRDFIVNTDFGEIREMVEGCDEGVLKTLGAFNTHLWRYPAKVGTVVATLIPLINTAMRASREVMLPIVNAIGPDLFADIILSLVKGVNGTDTAKLVNTVKELYRRLHTGSLLIGKGSKPLLQMYLTDLMGEYFKEIDPELARKVSIMLAEDKEAIANAYADAASANPQILLSHIASIGAVKSSGIRAGTRRLSLIENLDETGLKEAVTESMTDLDTFEAAELINTASRVINKIHDARPDLVANLISGVVDSLKTPDIVKTAEWLVPDVVAAIKPLATTVMPLFIKSLSELISPDEGYASPEHKQAMESLRTALTAGSRG